MVIIPVDTQVNTQAFTPFLPLPIGETWKLRLTHTMTKTMYVMDLTIILTTERALICELTSTAFDVLNVLVELPVGQYFYELITSVTLNVFEAGLAVKSNTQTQPTQYDTTQTTIKTWNG